MAKLRSGPAAEGRHLEIPDFVRLLKARWLVIGVTIVVTVAGAALLTMLITPLYQSSTRLFVSAASDSSAREIYQGNLFSQQRVSSYTKLLTGEALAQRTIDKLDLDMTAEELQRKITADAPPGTVLIDLSVLDPSPDRARTIAEVLSNEFVVMVDTLETPPNGASPGARVTVVQSASLPTAPVVPKWARNITAGLVLGVLAGFGVALLRDVLDRTVKDPKVLEDIAGVGVVGSIPRDKKLRRKPTIAFDSDRSAVAEAFRELRTNLQFLAVDDPPRVIVVTGPTSNEGKTTTATNLALALAEAGHNVVLVAGDMRHHKTNSYLARPVGFSTLLSGRASLADVLLKTRFARLAVLPTGAIPPNPSELLGSLAASRILEELRDQFDYVLVDSPPMLAVTDAAVLAARADGALMVARFGATRRDHVADAVANLDRVGARLLGMVLTFSPTREETRYVSSSYGDDGAPPHPSATQPRDAPPRADVPAQPPRGGPERRATSNRRGIRGR